MSIFSRIWNFFFGRKESPSLPAPVKIPEGPPPPGLPASDWDGLFFAKEWTESLIKSLQDFGPWLLAGDVPSDMKDFVPSSKPFDRKSFYVALISCMAREESNFDPQCIYVEDFDDVSGNRVVSRGLLQVSIESVNAYGARIQKAKELHDVATNLRCAVIIMEKWVRKDGCIATGKRGGARYWSTLRGDKRDLIASRVRKILAKNP